MQVLELYLKSSRIPADLNFSWEVNSSLARQEILHVLWYPKVHCLFYNSPPFVPTSSHLIKIHFNTVLPSNPKSSSCNFPSGFPPKHRWLLFLLSLISDTRPRPSRPSWFDQPNNVWRAVQSLKLPIGQFSPVSFQFVPSKSKYCPQRLVPVHPPPVLFCYCERPSFAPVQNSRRHRNAVYPFISICSERREMLHRKRDMNKRSFGSTNGT